MVFAKRGTDQFSRKSILTSEKRRSTLPLLILEDLPQPLPPWLTHYTYVSYTFFAIHAVFAWLYLAFVGVLHADKMLLIQYEPVYRFMTYNSYSILSPLLCTIFVTILSYNIKTRVKLDDGDFFGFVGCLLLLGLVSTYDATGILKLYWNIQPPYTNFNSKTNELAWKYAWSTRPSCARVHARIAFKEHEQHKAENERTEAKSRPMHLRPESDENLPNTWMYTDLNKDQILKGILKRSIPDNNGSATVHRTTDHSHNNLDETTYADTCHSKPDAAKRIKKPRDWMIAMQKKFKCCGPNGYKQWSSKVEDLSSCKKSNSKEYNTKGCLAPFSKYIGDIFLTSCIIMFIQAFMYILTIIIACVHYAVMKYDATRLAKTYSLLEFDVDENITVIEIDYKLSSYDPLQKLYEITEKLKQANQKLDLGRSVSATMVSKP